MWGCRRGCILTPNPRRTQDTGTKVGEQGPDGRPVCPAHGRDGPAPGRRDPAHGRHPSPWEARPRPWETNGPAHGRLGPAQVRHTPPPGDEACQEVSVWQSTGMPSSHQLLGSSPAVGSISCLRTRNSPPCPFVTTVTQSPGGTQANRNTPCPLPSRKEGRGGQDSVAPRDRRCPWGWDSSKSRATRSRHATLPGSGQQRPWESLPWEAWAVPLCTCASHECLLGCGDLGLSGRRASCPSPESSVWELVRSLPTGGQSCGRSAQGAERRNQSIPVGRVEKPEHSHSQARILEWVATSFSRGVENTVYLSPC